MKRYRSIIWDWNGTLYNDAEACCRAFNVIMGLQGLPGITLQTYREIYRHPVQKMYEDQGFDFSKMPMEEMALRWIASYRDHLNHAALHNDAEETLLYLNQQGMQQCLLSAFGHDFLLEIVQQLRIEHYFDQILGLQDHMARCKISNGRTLMETLAVHPGEVLFIGDSGHDVEAAREIGVDCVLLSRGLEDEKRVRSRGVPVFADLPELVSALRL